jgi:2-oxoglutarate ferredoxin oxidoreductase subunit alpha
MTELPLVVIDVQRGGPSTGLPTKTEQSDLLQALYSRNGEAPCAIIAAQSPVDCFDAAVEAVHIATKYMTPVILLSDGFIANGAEPWKVPDITKLPDMGVTFRTDPQGYQIYARDEKTLARAWVKPGTKGLEHRVGGLEKDFLTGAVSYDNMNHQRMVDVRADKITAMQQDIALPEIAGAQSGDVLLVGWGGTWGSLRQTVLRATAAGKKVGHLHLRWLNPFPRGLEEVFGRYKKIVVCELNGTHGKNGQLWKVLRAEFLLNAESFTKVQGTPFTTTELEEALDRALSSI